MFSLSTSAKHLSALLFSSCAFLVLYFPLLFFISPIPLSLRVHYLSFLPIFSQFLISSFSPLFFFRSHFSYLLIYPPPSLLSPLPHSLSPLLSISLLFPFFLTLLLLSSPLFSFFLLSPFFSIFSPFPLYLLLFSPLLLFLPFSFPLPFNVLLYSFPFSSLSFPTSPFFSIFRPISFLPFLLYLFRLPFLHSPFHFQSSPPFLPPSPPLFSCIFSPPPLLPFSFLTPPSHSLSPALRARNSPAAKCQAVMD